MMREQNRLGALQMSIAGKNHAGIFFGGFDKFRLQVQNQLLNLANLAAHVKMSIKRDLVIATASRVKSAACRPD